MIYKTYSGGHTTVLTRDDSLCYKCIRNQMIWRRAKHKSEQDSKLITTLLSDSSATEKTRLVCNLRMGRPYLAYTIFFLVEATKGLTCGLGAEIVSAICNYCAMFQY